MNVYRLRLKHPGAMQVQDTSNCHVCGVERRVLVVNDEANICMACIKKAWKDADYKFNKK